MTDTRETVINQLTASEDLRHTIEIRSTAPPGGKIHGRATTILLEGHDISHLVSEFSFEARTDDATRVELRLVGLRPV